MELVRSLRIVFSDGLFGIGYWCMYFGQSVPICGLMYVMGGVPCAARGVYFGPPMGRHVRLEARGLQHQDVRLDPGVQ